MAKEKGSRPSTSADLATWFRQGAGEMGQALKAFPDSIQHAEPGGLMEPTQREVHDAKHAGGLYGRLQEGRERGEAAREKESPQKGIERE